MTLSEFAFERRAAAPLYLLLSSNRMPLLLSIDGTDGRTDGRTTDRLIDPTHTIAEKSSTSALI